MHLELLDIIMLLFITIGALFWWDTHAVREYALRLAKSHCQKHQLQLLDESVSLMKWRIKTAHGGLVIHRHYTFEFTSTGESRYSGNMQFVGKKLLKIEMSAYHILRDD